MPNNKSERKISISVLARVEGEGALDISIRKNKIDGGDKCGTKVAGTQGPNFEAGAGFWIRPNDRNRIAVMATQHHNSCNGNSRWGITPHWFD